MTSLPANSASALAAAALVEWGCDAEPLALDRAALEAFLAERIARSPGQALRAKDLALACACRLGDPDALARFAQRYLPPARRTLARAGVPAVIIDDVIGGLTARLFAAVERAPLIDGYSGRGELGAWTRSVALHSALKAQRAARRHVALDAPTAGDDRGDSLPLADPELVYLRQHYADALAPVLEAAFAALSRDERAILRQYYRHGLTIDDLGRLHGTHRVTAARRIKRAREALVREVRARAQQRLGVSDPTLDSIFQLVASRLRVEHLLRSTPALDAISEK